MISKFLLDAIQQQAPQQANPFGSVLNSGDGSLMGFLRSIGVVPDPQAGLPGQTSMPGMLPGTEPARAPTGPVQTPASKPQGPKVDLKISLPPPGNAGPPLAGPRPGGPVQPSARVWGDQEAIDAGLYENPAHKLTAPGHEPKRAPAAPTAPQAPSFDQRYQGEPMPGTQPMRAPAEPMRQPVGDRPQRDSFDDRFGEWGHWPGDTERPYHQPVGGESGLAHKDHLEPWDMPAPWVHSALGELGLKVNPEAWDKFIREAPKSLNIEDRRPLDANGQPMDLSVEDQLKAIARERLLQNPNSAQ